MNTADTSRLVWAIAELLRGDYKQSEYGKVILPFLVLRRLDCVLEPTKKAVLAEYEKCKGMPESAQERFLVRASKVQFYNTSPMDFQMLHGDPSNIRANLTGYLGGFSANVRDVFERFKFQQEIDNLDASNLLFLIVQKFAAVDLHPDRVLNEQMGAVFEELLHKFADLSNVTAGEHFTPREVIRLMVELLFAADDEALTQDGVVRRIYDPTAGTGGMLSVAEDHLRRLNPDSRLVVFGQELNPESYAICKADMLIKGHDISNIVFGNTLSNDGLIGKLFDYMLSNPPFGVEWKKIEDAIRKEFETRGFEGRFGPGLPRVSDGSLLFLLHLISKMRPAADGGSRIGIVLNGSPLFTGGAGSGESEIRKWIFERDMLEAIVALPTDMFYNTGIATYIWIVTNHKAPERKGKVQLINAADFYQKMRKSLGSKRKEMGESDIAKVIQFYGAFENNEFSKIFDNNDFGYSTITVERPLKLNFSVVSDRLDAMNGVTALAKLGKDGLAGLKAALSALGQDKVWKNRDAFAKDVKKALAKADISLAPPQMKALIQTLSERDETADVCTDAKGRPESYAELRDTENVPLKDSIKAYFDREVLPHVPDAWIDDDKTKVGYEIPFTRHFYKYVPPRPLQEIDAEMRALSSEIMELLGEVTA